jgi:glycine betaine/proline transport system permease protein
MFEDKVIPLDKWVQEVIDYLVYSYRDFFQALKMPIEKTLNWFDFVFNYVNPVVMIIIFALLAYKYSGVKLSLFAIFSLVLIGLLGLFSEAMTTLAMITASVFFCVVVGIPLGILSGKSDRFESILRPILDAMQTTPAFVYLIPVVMLFSIGTVSGVIATIIFALPPIVRLTSLGIRQVDKEIVEAGIAFGATSWQLLIKVQLPQAMPTIMAGLNQTMMMALSMVVIAALIGSGGLGEPVFRGLNNLDIGLAFIGGLSIVLLAIILDRLTQSIGKK